MTDEQIAPELVARMVAFFREEAGGLRGCPITPREHKITDIAADLPPAEDPDLTEARAITAEIAEHVGSVAFAAAVRVKKHDKGFIVQRIFAALKRRSQRP